MKEIAGDKLRGHLETVILATLEQGEAHGLEILRRLELRGCGLLRLKEGSLYPALYRMESAGGGAAALGKEPHGRRGARRRIYRLTAKGGRKLKQGRGEWQTFVETMGAILATAVSAPAGGHRNA